MAACGTGQPCTETDYPAGDQDNGHYYFQHKALLEHLANWYWVNVTDGKTKLAVVRPSYIVGEHFDNSGLQTLLSKFVVYPDLRDRSTNSCGTQTWSTRMRPS